MEASGSEGEGEGEEGVAAAREHAPNTFRFRTFAARLAAVDVDLRRRLGPLHVEPTQGTCDSCTAARSGSHTPPTQASPSSRRA